MTICLAYDINMSWLLHCVRVRQREEETQLAFCVKRIQRIQEASKLLEAI